MKDSKNGKCSIWTASLMHHDGKLKYIKMLLFILQAQNDREVYIEN